MFKSLLFFAKKKIQNQISINQSVNAHGIISSILALSQKLTEQFNYTSTTYQKTINYLHRTISTVLTELSTKGISVLLFLPTNTAFTLINPKTVFIKLNKKNQVTQIIAKQKIHYDTILLHYSELYQILSRSLSEHDIQYDPEQIFHIKHVITKQPNNQYQYKLSLYNGKTRYYFANMVFNIPLFLIFNQSKQHYKNIDNSINNIAKAIKKYLCTINKYKKENPKALEAENLSYYAQLDDKAIMSILNSNNSFKKYTYLKKPNFYDIVANKTNIIPSINSLITAKPTIKPQLSTTTNQHFKKYIFCLYILLFYNNLKNKNLIIHNNPYKSSVLII